MTHSLTHTVHNAIYNAATNGESELPDGVKRFMQVLDSLLYCFLPLFYSMLLRLMQGRELLARLGKRTLVIGEGAIYM